MKSTFADSLARLKQQLGLSTDRDVAALLGLTEKAFNARKSRGSFPEDKLFALATRRPELGVDPEFVLSGKDKAGRVKERLDAFPSRLLELRGSQAPHDFAKRVGIPSDVLAALESGRAMPTSDQVIRLIRAFPEHSPSWIAGGDRPTLDDDLNYLEIVLIRNYRMCSPEVQDQLRRTAAAGSLRAHDGA